MLYNFFFKLCETKFTVGKSKVMVLTPGNIGQIGGGKLDTLEGKIPPRYV